MPILRLYGSVTLLLTVQLYPGAFTNVSSFRLYAISRKSIEQLGSSFLFFASFESNHGSCSL